MQLTSITHSKRRRLPVVIDGHVVPGFEEVRTEFERNFAERDEIGAAVAAYVDGEKVVDLWGGYRTPECELTWREDTMVIVFSTTKGFYMQEIIRNLDFYLFDDPREKALRDALYRAIARTRH